MDFPRVTQEDLVENILVTEVVTHTSPTGKILRWGVLTTKNGFAVTGRPSAAVSAENDDPARGSAIAITNAKTALWELMGYELASRLSQSQGRADIVSKVAT